MKLRLLPVAISCAIAASSAFASTSASNFGSVMNPVRMEQPASVVHWNDNKKEMDAFISDLISKMTLEEKIGQLDLQSGIMAVTGSQVNHQYEDWVAEGKVGSVFNNFTYERAYNLQKRAVEESRLGIPIIIGHDIIHGHKTIFPQSIGEVASWDLEVAEVGARVAAKEATADGIMWTFAPMADLVRDPRWGRVSEAPGEDPFLATQMSVARVKGFQGDNLSDTDTMMATAKHMVGYGLSQAGRDYGTTDVSDYELWSSQMPMFKAMVDAGIATVMTSFNDLNGIPASGSHYLLTEVLRDKWGFEGFVVTDYTAVNELVPHGYARDDKHAAEIAFNAGADMDMVGKSYMDYMAELVAEGKVDEAKIDHSVRLILEMKWRLGLFEDPYRYFDKDRAETDILTDEHLELARDAARKSSVLLSNNGALPLNLDKIDSIALLGPLADRKQDMIGNWAAAGDRRNQPVSIKEGLEARLGKSVKIHTAGRHGGATYAHLHDADETSPHIGIRSVARDEIGKPALKRNIEQAVKAAKKADVIVLAIGEEQRMSGEAASRVEITLPGNQRELMEELKKLGKPMVGVVMSGRPNDLSWEYENLDAILHAWYPGTSGGHAIADLLVGDYNPSGKLPMTFPRSVGQIPIYYNMKNTGRPYDADNENQRQEHYKSRYDDSPNTPLFAFGHGLSYTTFDYSDIKLSSDTLKIKDDELSVSVTITNSGDFAGEEVVQLYTRQLVGSRTRPVKELKGFQKIHFEKGESKDVTFTLTAEDLSFYRGDMTWGPEASDFHVFVGTSSDDVQKAEFKLVD
ncbi:beta-glucosidase [Endozoicomonas montiporae]|uniref:beta-glucosidase n=3 Tax=Endozoicomonas montiporae TaxID=1027273 RepID=A0A081MZ22_9GAMM|nr:beta-glucosidase [Endozoicomonas montiporae CL-33]KEQ11445.1 beta-glucosidase [Endozoicomonas montiporae]